MISIRNLLLLTWMSSLAASELGFTHKPSVTRDGAISKVRFELSASTDVEVSAASASASGRKGR